MFDATQEDAVGCGVWRMMLTFLELVYMFDATQEGAKDTIASEIKTLNTTKKNRLPLGLEDLQFENTMEIPQNQAKVL